MAGKMAVKKLTESNLTFFVHKNSVLENRQGV